MTTAVDASLSRATISVVLAERAQASKRVHVYICPFHLRQPNPEHGDRLGCEDVSITLGTIGDLFPDVILGLLHGLASVSRNGKSMLNRRDGERADRVIMPLEIADICELCDSGQIRWSAHAVERMLRRGISRNDVLECISNGEIIEEYPDNWLNPACLVFGHDEGGKALHVVVGVDERVHIVTAYRPDLATFMPDMKTRREG